MAGERIELPLGEVCDVKQGRYLGPRDMSEVKTDQTPIPVIGANGILGYTYQVTYREPVTLVTCRGSNCGMLQRTSGPTWISNNAMACPPKKPHDSRYIHYVLQSTDFGEVITGSAQPQITTGHLNAKLITITRDSEEQKTIAAVLGALDDKIELNRRMNATLEAMARALFQSWFVDFDPVCAKLDGRPPAALDPATAALFPDSFQDSELGHIPKGWTVRPLTSLACYLSRGIGPSYLEHGGVCVLNQKCVRDHRVDFSKSRRHDAVKKPINDRALMLYDILVNSTGMGTLGRVAQVFHLPEVAIVDSHVTIVRSASDIDPFFLGINLTGREAEIEELGEGSTGQTELSRTRLGEMKVIAPPFDLQKAFGVAVGPLLKRINENETQSSALATLRDTLLPKLLSGELSVAELHN